MVPVPEPLFGKFLFVILSRGHGTPGCVVSCAGSSVPGKGVVGGWSLFTDRRFSVLAFVLLVLFWGSAFGAIKISLEYAPPILFAGTRTLLCGVVMTLAPLLWSGGANVRDNWPVYLLLAFFNVARSMGLQHIPIL